MPSEQNLRALAREHLQAKTLPRRDPEYAGEGPGIGLPCRLCREPITVDQVEYELHVTSAGAAPWVERIRLHRRCFAAWEMERTRL
jgi:hypothetical protein